MKIFLLDKKTGQITQTIPETSPEYETAMNDIAVTENYHRIIVQDTITLEQIEVSFDPITQTYYPTIVVNPLAINTTVL